MKPPTSSVAWRRTGLVVLLLACVLALPADVAAKGSLSKLEDEFEKAIKYVTPATVVCLAAGVEKHKIAGGTSGVIVSRKGLVFSDGDAGFYYDIKKGKRPTAKDLRHSDDVEIRLPNLKGKGFQSFQARVIKRDRKLDTSLMRITKPPSSLKYVKSGDSDGLRVGDFAFAMGNSFGLAAEAPPTLTAGVVASLVPMESGVGGKWRHIYASAAVNLGVNGGPLVDIRGRLIGTISNAVRFTPGKKPDDPELAYAYLGKVIPIARLREFYGSLPEAEELFPKQKVTGSPPTESTALAMVFHHTGQRAYESIVSLEIKRSKPLAAIESNGPNLVRVPRFLGPTSGVLITADGWILTSLYNLTNIGALSPPGRLPVPPNASIKTGLDGIEKITVHLAGGKQAEAKLVARHEGICVAVLKAELGAGAAPPALLTPAPAEAYRTGRFVLALGNPYGANRLADPLLTVGILSKQHSADAPQPWAGQWQTDAGSTDANCGGPAVDLHGRMLGLMTIWSATRHGRNSGIGFIVPWTQIEPVLGELKRGRSFCRPLMGVTWKVEGKTLTTRFEKVSKDSAAEKAGCKPGDVLTKVDGVVVTSTDDVRKHLRNKWSGDTMVLTVERDGKLLDLTLTLGARE